MKRYDSNVWYITALRARLAVLANGALSLTCLIAGVLTPYRSNATVYYGVSAATATLGLMAHRTQELHQGIQNDIADVSDQVRTNSIYQRLEHGDLDYTASVYNYMVMQLGQGVPKGELLRALDKDEAVASAMWRELEQRYGKLPTGEY